MSKSVGKIIAATVPLTAGMTLSATIAPVVAAVRAFTGFGGLGMLEPGKTRWSLRRRTWRPRR